MKKIPNFNKDTAVLMMIDLQYESGPNGFWQAYNWDNTVKNNETVLNACREKGIPVVHVRVVRDKSGVHHHAYDVRDENGDPMYAIRGNKNTEIMKELKPIDGEIIVDKQRFSAFYQTNLDLVLQGLKADHLIMTGVFTDSCFLTSTYDAFTRGYTISIIKDACTAGTEASHKTSMLDMSNWIYGSSIFAADQLVKAINGEEYNAWFWEKPNSMAYELDNIDEMYDKLNGITVSKK